MFAKTGSRQDTRVPCQKGKITMKKARLHYLDAARGFAILLVVLGHIWETDQPLPVLIYSFHVPLFFMISGILSAYTGQERRSAGQLIRSRLRSLLVPYVFFEAVFILIFGIRNRFDFSSQHAHLYDCLLLSPLNVPMWFLPTLFFAELFLILLIRALRHRGLAAALCLILYLLPFVPGAGRILPDAVLRCFSSIGFLAAGYFGADLFLTQDPPLYLLLPAAAASGLLALKNGKAGIYKLSFHNPAFFTVCALTSSFCVIFLLKKLTDRWHPGQAALSGRASSPVVSSSPASTGGQILCALLVRAGQNSLTILGLHIIVLRILQEILGLRTDSVPGGLLALAGILILLTPVCAVLNRFFPFLVGKKRC